MKKMMASNNRIGEGKIIQAEIVSPEDLTPPSGVRILPDTLRPDETVRLDVAVLQQLPQLHRRGSLLVIDGVAADVGSHLLVEDPIIIGRENTGLQLRDGRISRRHAVVELNEESYTLHDLGSTNGTLVNGVRVARDHELQDGDKIYVGRTVIKFNLVDETEATYLRRMEQLAGTDDLTGLLAKHRFDSLLEEAVRGVRSINRCVSVLMMDLDGIKAVNDAHGHHMGAHTIREVGRMIGRAISGRGEGCRFGGDEFCVFLFGATLDQARALGENICAEVRATPYTVDDCTVHTTISVGVATGCGADASSQDLTRRADQALYRAKAAGRNRVCW